MLVRCASPLLCRYESSVAIGIRLWTVADEREMVGVGCQAAWTGMPRRLSRSRSPILDPRAPPALPSRQHAISTLNGMSAVQIVFAIIGACVAAAGLVWTVTWAVRSWRKSGPEVVAEVGQGQVDDRGILRVHFRSGDSKIMRLRRGSRLQSTPSSCIIGGALQ